MAPTVSLFALQLGVFVFLGVKMAAIHLALGRQSALGWLMGGLLIAIGQSLAFSVLSPSRYEILVAFVGMPLCFYAVSRSIRLLTGQHQTHRTFWLIVAAATGLAATLLLAGAPYLIPGVMLKTTLAAVAVECAWRLWHAETRHPLDAPLIALLVGISGYYAYHVPHWLLSHSLATPDTAFVFSPAHDMFLTALGAMASLIVLFLMWRSLSQLMGQLLRRSTRDDATGLYRRDAFMARAEDARGRRGVVAFCDIDKFKRINDRLGHAAGDRVIADLAFMLSATSPIAGRMGGDEFAILLPDMDCRSGKLILDRLRRQFGEADHALPSTPPAETTISFGIACYDADEALSVALGRADRALYAAKRKGRNCVVVDKGRYDVAPIAEPRMPVKGLLA
ncbi:GGDEF domain-containing protein [Sphingomicrobium sp. XHP0239]|uniref:GGDEF domain-containing protein n=1 Tax=Sphingomicrobium maritimum TaxID=3133972 RepID=UPI0031CC7CBC